MANITKEYLDKKFGSIDKRFDGVDKRFDSIDKRFDGVDKRFDSMDKRFEGVDKRFDGVDKQFIQQTAELKAYSDKNQADLARMTSKGFEEIMERLNVDDRMSQLEKEFALLKKSMSKVTEALNMQI